MLAGACITAIGSQASAEVIRFGAPEDAAEPDVIKQPTYGTVVLRYDAHGRLIHTEGSRSARNTAVPALASIPVSGSESLAIVRTVAARYQDHPILRELGLSRRDWTAFFQAMIRVESGFQPQAESPAGAIGLAQLMPATAEVLRVDAHDPVENLDGGARYLLAQMHRFGSIELALAAYNAGPEAVEHYGGIPPYAETEAHVRKVMAEYRRLLSMT